MKFINSTRTENYYLNSIDVIVTDEMGEQKMMQGDVMCVIETDTFGDTSDPVHSRHASTMYEIYVPVDDIDMMSCCVDDKSEFTFTGKIHGQKFTASGYADRFVGESKIAIRCGDIKIQIED